MYVCVRMRMYVGACLCACVRSCASVYQKLLSKPLSPISSEIRQDTGWEFIQMTGYMLFLLLNPDYISYIRHLSYCFYIAVNRICVAISRVDGALKPWSAIHLGVGNSKQKPA